MWSKWALLLWDNKHGWILSLHWIHKMYIFTYNLHSKDFVIFPVIFLHLYFISQHLYTILDHNCGPSLSLLSNRSIMLTCKLEMYNLCEYCRYTWVQDVPNISLLHTDFVGCPICSTPPWYMNKTSTCSLNGVTVVSLHHHTWH